MKHKDTSLRSKMEFQTCGICKKIKEINHFKNIKNKILKNCLLCREKQKDYYNKNKEARLEYGKNRNNEKKDSLKEYNKLYYKENKDTILTKQNEYNKSNKESKKKYDLQRRIRIQEDKAEKQSDKSSS